MQDGGVAIRRMQSNLSSVSRLASSPERCRRGLFGSPRLLTSGPQQLWSSAGLRIVAIIHIDSIARAAHLLPVFGSSFVPEELHFSDALDVYCAYFVNNNVDHHCNEFLSTS